MDNKNDPYEMYRELRDNPNLPDHIRKLYAYPLMLSTNERKANMEELAIMLKRVWKQVNE